MSNLRGVQIVQAPEDIDPTKVSEEILARVRRVGRFVQALPPGVQTDQETMNSVAYMSRSERRRVLATLRQEDEKTRKKRIQEKRKAARKAR